MKKILIIALVILCSCHDTRSFETARKVKTGMTIAEIESIMEEPLSFERINDSTEQRKYVYDNPNGMDKILEIKFINGRASLITDRY